MEEPINAIDIKAGRLRVVQKGDGTDSPFIGIGAKVYWDGEELDNVTSVTLVIACDEVVKATIERLV